MGGLEVRTARVAATAATAQRVVRVAGWEAPEAHVATVAEREGMAVAVARVVRLARLAHSVGEQEMCLARQRREVRAASHRQTIQEIQPGRASTRGVGRKSMVSASFLG